MDLFQTAGTGHCAGGYCVPTGCIRADKTGQGGQALHVASHIQVAFGCDSKPFFSCTGGAVLGTTKTFALLSAHHTSLTCLGRGTC